VSEGRGTGSDDLDEGVQVLNLVGVAGSVSVNTSHALALRSTKNTKLGLVDIVVQTIQESDNDTSGDAFEDCLQVVEFVDGTGTTLVFMESAHGPSDGTTLLTKVGMMLFTSLLEHASVSLSGILIVEAVSALRHDLRRRSGAAHALIGDVDGSATELASSDF